MNYTIENFIGTFDGYFSEEFCDESIKFFEEMDRLGLVLDRKKLDTNFSKLEKNDSMLFAPAVFNAGHSDIITRCFTEIFWGSIYPSYLEKYEVLYKLNEHSVFTNKMQRTRIGEGYHIWHCEHTSKNDSNRLLVYTVYLNDVDEGGETEFLYYPKRVAAKKGRVLVFPAGFTHTHRGNPPISNDKYIMTGWVEF